MNEERSELLVQNDELERARQRLAELGATRVRIEFQDLNGSLRGKNVPAEKVLSGKPVAVADALLALTINDDLFDSAFTSADAGYPDMVAFPDWSTLSEVPWERGLAAVIGQARTKSGGPVPVDPRTALANADERCRQADFAAQFACEFEFFLFRFDAEADQQLRSGSPGALVPASREHNFYSLTRWPDTGQFVSTLLDQAERYGVPIEAVHAELGHGMMEVSLAPGTPLEAADRAARFKVACREIAMHHGFIATFIAKWKADQSGSSGHVHQSLLRDGANVFWSGAEGELSESGRHYLGGLLATAGDFSAFTNPFPNSYRRLDPDFWAPVRLSWGSDNRNACVRVITPNATAARLEFRRPGADLQPYMTIAACLDGGLHGIAKGIEPREESSGRGDRREDGVELPRDLRSATTLLRNSEFAHNWYGSEFVEHFALSRDVELDYYQKLADANIPEWELSRYFERA